MTELPRHLAPWAAAMAPFARDLQLTLGPWIARIALAVGPLHTSRTAYSDEPDGVGGLSRRGPYERLLISEWAIADELPDEFLRRAAMREQLFIELARRSPAGATRSVILFDAGPSQLGNPRIAHLAALVVFARRAADANADLRWGVLQRLGAGLHAELTRESAAHLLSGRSAIDVSDALLDAWLELAGAPGKPDDLWFVGGDDLGARARARGASALIVSEDLEPGARRVELRAHRGAMKHAPIVLDMPDPDDCVRLLRNPFELREARPAAPLFRGPLQLEPALQFSGDGRRILVRSVDGGFVAWPIPAAAATSPGRLKRFAPPIGHRLVAAGTLRRRRIAVTVGDDYAAGIHVHGVGIPGAGGHVPSTRVGGPWARVFRDWDPTSGKQLPQCVLATSTVSDTMVPTFLAPNGDLIAVPRLTARCEDRASPFTAETIARDTIAFAPAPDGVVAVVAETRRSVSVAILRHQGRTVAATIDHAGAPQVFIGYDTTTYPLPGPIAVSVGPWSWHILFRGEVVTLMQDPAYVVCGVAVRNQVPGLVVFDTAGTFFHCGDRVEPLVRTAASIAYAHVGATNHCLAWMTEQAEIGVYSMTRDEKVMYLRTEQDP